MTHTRKPDDTDYKQFCRSLYDTRENFHKNVNDFFSTSNYPKRPILNKLSDLLDTNFIIGEVHQHISPKRFFVTNAKMLFSCGYRILFMEHLYYDDQALLDQYLETGIMPKKLKKRLSDLDVGHGTPNNFGPGCKIKSSLWKKYNFTELIVAAREAGIRVVGLDLESSYEEQHDYYGKHGSERRSNMNYTAFKIIDRETDSLNRFKWCALMGNSHVKEFEGVKGVAELCGAIAIYLFDNDILFDENEMYVTDHFHPSPSQIKLNSNYTTAGISSKEYTFHADLLILQSPSLSIELQQPKYLKSYYLLWNKGDNIANTMQLLTDYIKSSRSERLLSAHWNRKHIKFVQQALSEFNKTENLSVQGILDYFAKNLNIEEMNEKGSLMRRLKFIAWQTDSKFNIPAKNITSSRITKK